MRTLLLLPIILTLSDVYGQRTPLRYIPIDSITIVPQGQNVKLDFKGRTKNTGLTPTAFPWLENAIPGIHWTGDTIYLTIDNERIQFVEIKGKGVDSYYFPAEQLESLTYKESQIMTIPYSIILENREDSVLFRLNVELMKKKRTGKWKQVYSQEKDVWIRKKDLDGVLIYELD